MPFFCHQVSYTTDARKRLLHDSSDRLEAIRNPIEKLGGSLRATYFTNGTFDVLAISEFPEDISSSQISIAFADGGAIATIDSTPLLTANEAASAWGKATTPIAKSSALPKLMAAAADH